MFKPPELPPYVEQVFDIVDLIPPGRVMAYGDVAEAVGRGGPRQVGTAMAKYGGAVTWWRVIKADGGFLAGHERRALANYREEGTPLNARGDKVDMGRARWFPDEATLARLRPGWEEDGAEDGAEGADGTDREDRDAEAAG